MNDFEYDVLQRKRMTYGAKHMKRGSKSRRCSLPSDNLTAAQLKARNGEVKTYDLDSPMTWAEFKQMPLDIQQTYITGIQNRFQVGLSAISRDLFHLSDTALRTYMTRANLAFNTGFRGRHTGWHWDRWLNPSGSGLTDADLEQMAEVIAEYEPEEPEEQETPESTNKKDPYTLDHLIVDFTGDFDPESFLVYLSRFPMPQGRVRIHMEVTAE